MNSMESFRSTAARPHEMPTTKERIISTFFSGSLPKNRLSGSINLCMNAFLIDTSNHTNIVNLYNGTKNNRQEKSRRSYINRIWHMIMRQLRRHHHSNTVRYCHPEGYRHHFRHCHQYPHYQANAQDPPHRQSSHES